nr:hypothetical protein [Patescibacteria group bacterium]
EYLSLKYGENCRALQGGIYSAFRPYIKTEIDITTAKQRCITYDWQLAKRQRTWFKRNQDIKWFENIESAKKWLIQKI